jgi:T-complex protein 1 subunit theta
LPAALALGKKQGPESDGTTSTTPAQIFDVLAAKYWALRYATGAAVSVLSVDSIIMSKPAGIKAPQMGRQDED